MRLFFIFYAINDHFFTCLGWTFVVLATTPMDFHTNMIVYGIVFSLLPSVLSIIRIGINMVTISQQVSFEHAHSLQDAYLMSLESIYLCTINNNHSSRRIIYGSTKYSYKLLLSCWPCIVVDSLNTGDKIGFI